MEKTCNNCGSDSYTRCLDCCCYDNWIPEDDDLCPCDEICEVE